LLQFNEAAELNAYQLEEALIQLFFPSVSTMSLKVLDLFSGIGGFSLGFDRMGWQTVGFCEIDKHCSQVLQKHWPNVTIFDDVTKLSAENFKENVDVICGGFPCQDISVAGKKAGISGSRSGLWKEFARLINEFKPKFAIIENVANLRGNGLITVLQDLWQIGYDAEWHCIPASALGAPHQRDRIWIIAHPNSKRFNHNQGTPARENGAEGRTECSEKTTAGGICSATRGLSENSSGTLANTNGTRKVVKRRADKSAPRESELRHLVRGRSGTDDQRIDSSKENEKMADSLRQRLAGHGNNCGKTSEERQILQYWQVSCFCCFRGTELWRKEPDIPRLKDNGLNPDWVEWLMGFPIGWTADLPRKHRLKSLGNAVVPIIPELISFSIKEFIKNGESSS
jgi:DNA-cytosine methyltransferase